ncbi:hypothetical protein Acsp03_43980 [Actinomadura sp. NBRC 104412]|uniref:hypothetical protein n=1 Tax=Actinomadura sp. NBRC 104412 TaxID=3032203 RepID=UPI0024A59EFA|nr:hypothetical protein [Actinomadura sp. NBRC 104412]GLZ06932.1 hypothetical protein Acsp03_43980 [Actinomadura sp. NBRC 104412]
MNASDLAQVLYTTTLQASGRPTAARVRAAIGERLLMAGPDVCAAHVAQEAGDHPEVYRERMRWALDAVNRAYAPCRLLAAA